MELTRYRNRDSRRESRDPYRTDPNLTGPTAYEFSPSTTSSSYVSAPVRDGVVEQ